MKICKCKSWSDYGGCRRTIHPCDFNIRFSLFSLMLENRIFSVYQGGTLSTLTLHLPIKLLYFVILLLTCKTIIVVVLTLSPPSHIIYCIKNNNYDFINQTLSL